MTATSRAVRELVRPNEPLAYRVNEFFVALSGLGRTTVYALIADGTLATVKIGGRRLVPRDAALALLSKGRK